MSSMQKPKRPYDLFYSYAEKDKALLKRLEEHLSVLRQEGDIRELHKRDITPGTEWQHEQDVYMKKASIILLLISPSFLASDYLYNNEMRQAITKCKAGKAIIIPVILCPCDWKKVPFGENEHLADYEIVPRSEKAVTSWAKRNEAYAEIAQAVRKAVQNLREYAEEMSMGIVSNRRRSIYPEPDQVSPQQLPPLEPLQINPSLYSKPKRGNSQLPDTTRANVETPKISPRSQSTSKKNKPTYQQNAQFVEETAVEPPWKTKKLPKSRSLAQIGKTYFTFDDISKYNTGIRGILLLFFMAIDVGVLTVLFLFWQTFQEEQLYVLVISALLFFWGVVNKNGLVALLLTTTFGITWIVVGLHFLPLNSLWVPIVVIAVSLLLSIARLFLFQEHKKRKSAFKPRRYL